MIMMEHNDDRDTATESGSKTERNMDSQGNSVVSTTRSDASKIMYLCDGWRNEVEFMQIY
jgi:hypothetical protein